MSRLDSFIRRMEAQKACLDRAAREIREHRGPVLEIGFGNGRTYDHLRTLLPAHPIYVFDRRIVAHQNDMPPPALTRLGDARETLQAFLAEGHDPAVLIHVDVGSADEYENRRLSRDLAPTLARLLAAGGYLISHQSMATPRLRALPLPAGIRKNRYYLYRRIGDLASGRARAKDAIDSVLKSRAGITARLDLPVWIAMGLGLAA